MHVKTMKVDRDLARSKYEAYKKALEGTHTDRDRKRDQVLKTAFYNLARGRKVIDLNQVAESTGLDAQGLPRIAVCRAGQRFVYYRRIRDGRPEFTTREYRYGGIDWHTAYYRVRLSSTLDWPVKEQTRGRYQRALVPEVPPELQPKGRLGGYHVLFEPEWKPTPPVDPLLLRHIGSSLYVVLAQWDLTDVERAALGEAFDVE